MPRLVAKTDFSRIAPPHCDEAEQAGRSAPSTPDGRLVARLLSNLPGCQGRVLPPIMLHVYEMPA